MKSQKYYNKEYKITKIKCSYLILCKIMNQLIIYKEQDLEIGVVIYIYNKLNIILEF